MTTRQNKRKVVVAMSGGVDSSVAAALSAQAGDEVVGLFMKNWEETDGSCPAAEDYEDVVSVCRQLDIPCYAVNFSEQYWERVFSQFLESLKRGETPNPDVLCNSEIKFDVLKEKAEAIGGTVLVTGHYCRARPCERGKLLLRGLDPNKDQSYFLHAVTAGQLANVEFPIGEYHKPAVRDLAKSFGLATAEKKDSQGICFIGKKNFREFLHQYLPYRPGEFRTL
ncbi:MAG: tRNA 2-thiouridine(34) synthase MnmA, partial [Chlamydiia bacterium]|nr:tRNA 2-thiouridine(34) synthase MnmA [Chlamydiia bacterium]